MEEGWERPQHHYSRDVTEWPLSDVADGAGALFFLAAVRQDPAPCLFLQTSLPLLVR